VAFDPAHDGYLVVDGDSAISASFVSADGVPLGSPAKVDQTAAWAQGCRLLYGAGAQGFLVAWHDARNDPNSATPFARIVRWDGAAITFVGNDFALSPSTTYQEAAPAIAYAPDTNQFLVAWQQTSDTGSRRQPRRSRAANHRRSPPLLADRRLRSVRPPTGP